MGCRFKSDSEYFIDFEEHTRDKSSEESPVPSFILGNNQGKDPRESVRQYELRLIASDSLFHSLRKTLNRGKVLLYVSTILGKCVLEQNPAYTQSHFIIKICQH